MVGFVIFLILILLNPNERQTRTLDHSERQREEFFFRALRNFISAQNSKSVKYDNVQ